MARLHGSCRFILEKASRWPRLTLCLALAAVFGVMFLSPLHASVVRHSSVWYKFVIWADAAPEFKPNLGDYVLVPWKGKDPNDAGLEDGTILTKRVGCLPGETIRIEDANVFYCNDRYLGHSLGKMPVSQKTLAPFPYEPDQAVPEGYVFLIGDTANSYDSRYLGLFPASQIQGKVIIGF